MFNNAEAFPKRAFMSAYALTVLVPLVLLAVTFGVGVEVSDWFRDRVNIPAS